MRPCYTIAVTGLNNTDNPGPGVPVIRCLRESESFDVKIIGLAYENLEPGIYMPNTTDKVYQIPYPSSGADSFMERISEINDIENIDLIIPNFDAELYTFMLAEKQLSKMNIKTFLPTKKQFEERHKGNLNEFGEKYEINVPNCMSINSVADIDRIVKEFTYPVFVKGKFYDAFLAYSPLQVQLYFNQIAAKWGIPVIIQEYTSGTEVNVVALGDGKGRTIGAVPMRKQYITDKGKAWGGITLSDKKMIEITNNLIAKTKWRGGMELEMIKTTNEEYYMIEINPRIPAWVYLAQGAGQNLPEALVNLAMGKNVKPFDTYKIGTMFIRYSNDLIGDISQFEKLNIYKEI